VSWGGAWRRQEWVNPVLAGRLVVRASSPACRTTAPRGIVSGSFLHTNRAGPRADGTGRRSAWWLLDLGPGHSLVCNYYTLRNDGSHDFMRSWVLQVSAPYPPPLHRVLLGFGLADVTAAGLGPADRAGCGWPLDWTSSARRQEEGGHEATQPQISLASCQFVLSRMGSSD
jgi:hypothetical protein